MHGLGQSLFASIFPKFYFAIKLYLLPLVLKSLLALNFIEAQILFSPGSQGLGLGLASGALGSINQGIQTGGTFGALGASTTPSVGFGGQSSVAGFGSSLGTPGVLGGGLGSTSLNLTQGTGFGAASSAGFGFGTPQASTAFGSLAGGTTPAVAATGTQIKSFQLQRPPAGNKRGKKR